MSSLKEVFISKANAKQRQGRADNDGHHLMTKAGIWPGDPKTQKISFYR
jgi:hypothetical protein